MSYAMMRHRGSPPGADRAATADSDPRRPALFLDRDGVLNRRIAGGYVTSPEALEVLSGAWSAARAARRAGASVIIVSNQGAIARRVATESDVARVNAVLVDALGCRGVAVDAVYVCPHHPGAVDVADRACDCRKPAAGMLVAAAEDLGLELGSSVMVGDKQSDAAAARAAGIPPSRILRFDAATAGDAGARSLEAAVRALLGGPLR